MSTVYCQVCGDQFWNGKTLNGHVEKEHPGQELQWCKDCEAVRRGVHADHTMYNKGQVRQFIRAGLLEGLKRGATCVVIWPKEFRRKLKEVNVQHLTEEVLCERIKAGKRGKVVKRS
jgi:hypothetical protein